MTAAVRRSPAERLARGEVEITHGKASAYAYWACRCDECRAAHAAKKVREYRRRERPSRYVRRSSPLERLLSKIEVAPSGCWLWQRSCFQDGYGQIKVDGKMVGAHRVAYELLVGPIPGGLQLDHLCRVRHCVNPAHLEPVTLAENNRRSNSPSAMNARKTHCKHGHEFTPENTYIDPQGSRVCRICRRVNRLRFARKAAEA